MDKDIARFTLRVDKELYKKFRYIAGYQGRSINKELEQYMKRAVAKFEQEVEKIPTEE